jgi:hypothetical protein
VERARDDLDSTDLGQAGTMKRVHVERADRPTRDVRRSVPATTLDFSGAFGLIHLEALS